MAYAMMRTTMRGRPRNSVPVPGIGNVSTGRMRLGKSNPKPRPPRTSPVGNIARSAGSVNKNVSGAVSRRLGNGGGTGGKTPPRTSGGGGGSNAKTVTKTTPRPAAPTAPGPVAPIVPSIEDYLAGDVDFQNQLRQFAKTLGDFNTNLDSRRTRLTADFGEGKRNMEKQKVDDLLAIKDDFASRGILGSGLYTNEVGDYNTNYAEALANFERQYNQSVGDLANESTQFNREQELQKEAARLDAVRRRAQKYGV